jgi:hypothetical protein
VNWRPITVAIVVYLVLMGALAGAALVAAHTPGKEAAPVVIR